MTVIQNTSQFIDKETYERIISHDDIHTGVRYNMSLVNVIMSYPVLYDGIQIIIKQKYDDNRLRYVPYIASVIAGKEKYNADNFYYGFGSNEAKSDQFQAWKKDLKKHIITNEHLHEFWLL